MMLSATVVNNRQGRRAAASGFPVPEKVNFTIREVCHISGVSRSKVYLDIRDGRLKVFHVGRRTLIAAADLVAWIDSYRLAA